MKGIGIGIQCLQHNIVDLFPGIIIQTDEPFTVDGRTHTYTHTHTHTRTHTHTQSANDLKAQVGSKKADGISITVTTRENAIRKTFGKGFNTNFEF